MSKLIYVVDDEEKIRELIKTYLVKEGYEVCVFDNGESALNAFKERFPDMLVIDIMMPGMDGYSLCREIRKFSDVPIIIVSAKGDEIDKVLGLELGSDDYISKPFSPRELVARVKTIFRRAKSQTARDSSFVNMIKCGDLVIYPDERKVLKDDIEIDLTAKEYDFLYFLIKNKNIAFTREQLIQNVWGYDYSGDERSIDDLVKRLRKKLSAVNSSIKIITVWGYGYKIEI